MYRAIAATVVLGVGFLTGWQIQDWRYTAKIEKIQASIAKEREASARQRDAEQTQARAKERELQANADRLRKDTDVQIRNINARATALANILRQRPERSEPATPSEVPSTAGTCRAATGAELARGDGEFLAGYAADAAKLQAAFDQCVEQYNAVRQQ